MLQTRPTIRPPFRRGFTALELIIVLLILSITSVIGLDAIATFEANQRADRGARETLAFFRYARHLAMTTGKAAKVEIDSVNKTISVYWKSNGVAWDATPVAQSLGAGGLMKLDFANARELKGTSLSVTPAGTTSFTYSALGACSVRATLTFSYASKAKTLVVPMVGDPQLNGPRSYFFLPAFPCTATSRPTFPSAVLNVPVSRPVVACRSVSSPSCAAEISTRPWNVHGVPITVPAPRK